MDDVRQPLLDEPVARVSAFENETMVQLLVEGPDMLLENTMLETDDVAVSRFAGDDDDDLDDYGDGDRGVLTKSPVRSAPSPREDAARTMNWFQLMLLCFLWTAGGCYGIETAVGAGGPLLTVVGVFIAAVVWGVPQALMSAELSLMIEENGGNFQWVQRGLGPVCSWINGWNLLLSSLISQAVMVTALVSYIPAAFAPSPTQAIAVKGGVVLVSIFFNLLSFKIMAISSLVLVVATYLPFLVLPFVAWEMGKLAHFQWQSLLTVPPLGEINWSLLLSTLIWCFGGFDSVGAAAGEVKGGKRSYVLGVFSVFPLALLNYAVPVMTAYAVDGDWKRWTDGYFSIVADSVSPAFGLWVSVCGVLSMFSQYNAAVVPLSRMMWATANQTGVRQLLPTFISWSYTTKNNVIVPLMAIIVSGVAVFATTLLPSFEVLVEIYLFFRLVNLLFEFAAFVALRVREPHTARPFLVGGGIPGAILICLPVVIVTVLQLSQCSAMVLEFCGVAQGAILILYTVRLISSVFGIRCWKPASIHRAHANSKSARQSDLVC